MAQKKRSQGIVESAAEPGRVQNRQVEEDAKKSAAATSSSLSPLPSRSRLIVRAVLVLVTVFWTWRINTVVPEPYLDEVFHVGQAQTYWLGKWRDWDPKLTTPPGLYVVSYLAFAIPLIVFRPKVLWSILHGKIPVFSPLIKTSQLRWTNAVLGSHFMPAALWRFYDSRLQSFDGSWPADASHYRNIDHTVLNICLFPVLFFFSGLYYTDVLALLVVLHQYATEWQQADDQLEHRRSNRGALLVLLPTALFALAVRQTNIFWAAIFCGGLRLVREIERTSDENSQNWKTWDPPVAVAGVEDYLQCSTRMVVVATNHALRVVPALLPYIAILAAFGGFVLWNGGVVLGDKENHIAGIHLAQMLYIWPYFIFFSWPLLVPHLVEAFLSNGNTAWSYRFKPWAQRMPRLWVAQMILAAMLAVAHYNTVVHPFIRADNRHYVFYVFRYLLWHRWVRYGAVPVYFVCAWAAINLLGGLPESVEEAKAATKDTMKVTSRYPKGGFVDGPRVRVSFVLVWLIATSLSVITAPLVEPRYFLIPWVMWRLHIPIERSVKRRSLDVRLTLETVWFLAVNFALGYMFLYKGFAWQQEPGNVQRFMW